MKKIIVPIDFSPNSLNAFEYALRLADAFLCQIEVLHIYNPAVPDYPYMPVDVMTAIMEGKKDAVIINFTEYIKGLSEEIAELFHKVPVNLDILPGMVVRDIIEISQEMRADLIVMGTKGASGLKETFVGSITGEVMESANCPVLAIPEEANFAGIQSIALTTDFSDQDEKVISYLQIWAYYFKAKINCIHVDLKHTHKYTRKMDQLASHYGESGNTTFEVLDGNDLFKEISSFIKTNNIDILAMVIHQRNMLQELFSYSNTKKMVYHTKTPILAMQADLFE